ncbi:MAG: hypothetical protein GX318_02560 [Clostridia bacterium]|nr:hypothetical protein [Clostridia bacterium]
MRKRKRLTNREILVLGLVWIEKEVLATAAEYSNILNIDEYEVRKAINLLDTKRWINKENCGRNGLRLTIGTREIPGYAIKIINDNLSLYDNYFNLKSKQKIVMHLIKGGKRGQGQ